MKFECEAIILESDLILLQFIDIEKDGFIEKKIGLAELPEIKLKLTGQPKIDNRKIEITDKFANSKINNLLLNKNKKIKIIISEISSNESRKSKT